MRAIAYVFFLVILTFGLIAVAQDRDDDNDTFAPSEAVQADTAVAFPTDI